MSNQNTKDTQKNKQQEAQNSEIKKLNAAKRWFFVVGTTIGCVALIMLLGRVINVLSMPVGVLLWTVVFVFCLRNVVNSLEARGVPRAAGTTIAYILMFVVLGLVGFVMVSPTVGLSAQFVNLINTAPEYAQKVAAWAMSKYEEYSYILASDSVSQVINQATGAVTGAAQEVAKASATGVLAFGGGVVNTVICIGFALVIAFWILLVLPALGRECNRLIAGSKREEDWKMLHVTVTRIMAGYIKATLLQCGIIAVACGILFFALGIPNFAAIALITGVMNIIPVVGPWIGGAIAAILGFFVSPVAGIAALVGTIIIQQFVYTFISPAIMKDSVDIHPALTLIGLLIGSAVGTAMNGLVGSIVGMLLAVPLVAVAKSVFVYYFEKGTGRQIVAEDGVFFQGTPAEGASVDPLGDVSRLDSGNTNKIPKISQDMHTEIEKRIQGLDKAKAHAPGKTEKDAAEKQSHALAEKKEKQSPAPDAKAGKQSPVPDAKTQDKHHASKHTHTKEKDD